eukprot:5508603-Pyramimonas_sp.AAC.1
MNGLRIISCTSKRKDITDSVTHFTAMVLEKATAWHSSSTASVSNTPTTRSNATARQARGKVVGAVSVKRGERTSRVVYSSLATKGRAHRGGGADPLRSQVGPCGRGEAGERLQRVHAWSPVHSRRVWAP